jgi:hypothetical protein
MNIMYHKPIIPCISCLLVIQLKFTKKAKKKRKKKKLLTYLDLSIKKSRRRRRRRRRRGSPQEMVLDQLNK